MQIKTEKTEACARWLGDVLGAGSQRAIDLVDLAEEQGFSKSTLYRAHEKLPIRDVVIDGRKYWQLGLPDEADVAPPVAGGDDSILVNEDEGRWNWFLYRKGDLVRVDAPKWTSAYDDLDKAASLAGITKVQDCGLIEGCFSVDIYAYGNQPRWFFQFGGNLIYTVEVAGFPDYLEFLARIAPIATTALLAEHFVNLELEREAQRRKNGRTS